MRHPYRTIPLVVVTVVALTGCSVAYPFQLLLTVKNAEDGTPVEGVTVALETTNTEDHKHDFEWGNSLTLAEPHQTDTNGQHSATFQINSQHDRYAFWWLKLRKEGFETTVINIRPDPVPKSTQTTPLPVTVQMKPLPKKP